MNSKYNALTPEILFEDTHVIVLSKPAGMLSQADSPAAERSPENPDLVDWLRAHVGRNFVGLVHRLDRNTSGIMIVGKRTKSASRLTEALQKGEVERSYLAWVHGRLEGPVRWQHRLRKDRDKNVVHVVPMTNPQGQDAILSAHPVAYGAWEGHSITLVQFNLETGRSHQIRVQSAHEGYPLLGDVKYARAGKPGARGESFDSRAFGRPALHSHVLIFPHPMSGETMRFEAKLPADMAKLLPAGAQIP